MKKFIGDLINRLLVGIWFGVLFIALFTKDRDMMIIAVTSTIYAFPLFIRCMKEENADV
jgi:hypothetical protein